MAVEWLRREDAQVLVVDVQERLFAVMDEADRARMLNRTLALLEGARVLGLPTFCTEQYPKGLGPTIEPLREALSGRPRVEKLVFSACVPDSKQHLVGRRQVLVAGMETHICIFQTVRSLAERGYRPILMGDAVISRSRVDHDIGLQLCREAGAMVTTVESALFDLLGQAGTDEFKAISKAVR